MNTNKSFQLGLQVCHAGEYTSVECPPFELSKPPFDSIQPGCTGGREMKVNSRLVGYPLCDVFGFMSTEVVQHDVQILVLWRLSLDLLQKGKKLPGAGALSVSSFFTLVELVSTSDVIALLPERLSAKFSDRITVVEPPFPVAGFDCILAWSNETQLDPAIQWARGQIEQVVNELV
jgi:DNA-binding transcriptional LysR family regulator